VTRGFASPQEELAQGKVRPLQEVRRLASSPLGSLQEVLPRRLSDSPAVNASPDHRNRGDFGERIADRVV